MKARYRKVIKKIYAYALALSLVLHVFNMGGEDGLKPFHIPAAIACVMTLLYSKKEKSYILVCLFLCNVLVSAFLSSVSSSMSGFVNLFIVALCCYGVSKTQIDDLLHIIIVLIPIALMALLYEAISNPTYRFRGFYNDPNYLCTTLIVFFFLSILTYYRFDNKILRLIAIANIVMVVVLIIFTLSRTGLACIVLLLIATFANVIKRHIWKGAIVLLISVIAINHYAEDFIDNQYSRLYERLFENSDNLESAGELRSELSKQNLRFMVDNPIYLFWGMGPSATSGDNAKQIPGLNQYRKSEYRDHNTWTSCLSEYGLFALLFFSLLVLRIVKGVVMQNRTIYRHVCIATCLALLIFSLSIWQMTYLPFWWGLFLLGNKQLQEI